MPDSSAHVILGIDPGSLFTGFGVIQKRGRTLRRLQSGRIRLPRQAPPEQRFACLLEELDRVIEAASPDHVAVEDVFSHRNARSALMLGQARGVVLAATGRRGLAVTAYPPATIKKAVSGHGRAAKGQIQRMVQVLLGLDEVPSEDEADALAAAICHAMIGAQEATVARAARARKRRPNR